MSIALSPQQLSQFQSVVNTIIANWLKIKPAVTNWFTANPLHLSLAWQNVVDGLNQLVAFAQSLGLPGADKKALVMDGANQLLQLIVFPLLPAYVPTKLLQAIFDAILSGVIEFLVTKLNPTPTPVN